MISIKNAVFGNLKNIYKIAVEKGERNVMKISNNKNEQMS